MIIDLILILCSLHPSQKDSGSNGWNPGYAIAPTVKSNNYEAFALVGSYYDSNSNAAYLLGGGFRYSAKYGGADLIIAHVNGSDASDYAAIPIPSVFVTYEKISAHVSLIGRAVGFSVRVRALEF